MNAAGDTLPPQVEWVVVSNTDVGLGAGSIDRMIETASFSENTVGAVGPAIIADDSGYPSARAVPSLRTGIGHALFANTWTGNPWTRAYRNDTEAAPEGRDAGWLSGACLLARRKRRSGHH